MPPAINDSLPASILGWLLGFPVWFLVWTPLVALLEYATHRWIMHMANRVLDPKLSQLHAHDAHHGGANDHEHVDMPLKNCLLLTSPLFLALLAWGLIVGPLSSVAIPAAALFAWTVVYTYLWTRIHRAIHGLESNWFDRAVPFFRLFRDHHLRHHVHGNVNYGTVFPMTDYLFFTWHRPRVIRGGGAKRSRRKSKGRLRTAQASHFKRGQIGKFFFGRR